jgi:hypothetical protein
MEPDHIRYNRATGPGHDFLYTQITLMPVPQRGHILRAANDQRTDAPRVREEPWELQDCLSVVATRHLQGQTGMDAYITGRDGETARLMTLVPKPLSERPYDASYLQPSAIRPLTGAQLDWLPELTARLYQILPKKQQPHVEDLAHKLAQDIPSQTDLLRAYQRTSVTEVLAEYHARQASTPGIDDLTASIRIAQLNYPADPRTAITQPREKQAVQPRPSRLTRPEPDHGISR